jgi:hypothetical protein
MAACIDNKVWSAARAACAARTASVKGLGYAPMGRVNLRALRGLGDLNINTAAADPNDPCVIASQTPCPVFSTPTPYAPTTPSSPATPGTPSAVTTTAGFSRWGLLAALAVGGAALYFATKKKPS